MSYLFAFDFDRTIVDADADMFIVKLLKNGVPQHFRDFLQETNDWIEYMNKIFQHMHDEGVSIDDICACVREMEPNKGMLQLLTALIQFKTNAPPENSSPKIDLLIISDSNTLFITEFLKARVFQPLAVTTNSSVLPLNPFDIITNKSSVSALPDDNQWKPLVVTPYLPQTTCTLCPHNLCKGAAFKKYVEANGPYTSVFYTGDGCNDVCPALTMNQHDYVFARIGYILWKEIENSPAKLGIKATVVGWETADPIMEIVSQRLGIPVVSA